jgi:hypothetical protein
MEKENPGFRSTVHKGFHMKFTNGYTISVQWGAGNYCENRSLHEHDSIEWKNRDAVYDSPDAEIAVWDVNGEDLKFDNGDLVKAYVSPNEVAEWIYKVANFTSVEKEDESSIEQRKAAIAWWDSLKDEYKEKFFEALNEKLRIPATTISSLTGREIQKIYEEIHEF